MSIPSALLTGPLSVVGSQWVSGQQVETSDIVTGLNIDYQAEW